MSALHTKLRAESEFDVFRVHQDREFVSDFDRIVEETKRLGKGAKRLPRRGRKP